MDAEEWLVGYRARLAELEARAGRAQDALARAEATATSPDGAVTVTVDPAGGLRALVLSDRATQMGRTQLAATIVATAGTARRDAAAEAIAAMSPLLGDDSRAMRLLRGDVPTPPPTGSPRPDGGRS
ncbi:YbaB/EbfC family nucleoid-associated protein [Pseudonocardia humida]|uniref:YbaB/EbfC family nucleoid-associated protein n=1 Tax=Pseudonocardia humida TaxID=2800819 RepID=A0ABT1A3E7_9PSEU|nr:YbaB/EbfC family nucleoid-associated protein [Pseudonocardia humida]MCO1657470.1 YbaB/EbfC family nucleoid-associated protein [Pseudonocardia humida]